MKPIHTFLAFLSAAIMCSWTQAALSDPTPIALGEKYYPPESRLRHEEGVCVVKITVTAEGAIEDVTLTLSTGHPLLDNACLAGFQGQHMKPAIRNGRPTTVTAEVPVVWRLNSPNQMSIRVNPNNLPRTGGKYYPAESVRLHEEGVCVVKVSVSAQGDVKVLGLTHSSGFPRLDDACAAAFSSGELLPATRNSTAIDSTIELPVAWRLGEAGK